MRVHKCLAFFLSELTKMENLKNFLLKIETKRMRIALIIQRLLMGAKKRRCMSIDELNKFIDKMKDEDQTRASGNLLNNTQLAWLAAAQIARDKGYECAALMVEFSVYNIDYSESVTDSSTPLLDKLNTTTVFNNYKNKVLNSGLKDFSGGSWSFTIQKSDNADLFYALHRVSTSGTGFMIGNSIMYYLITVHDTFDFAYDNNYDDLFTTTVNNWAWLCQQTHVLNPIEINLSTAIG